MLYAVQHEAAWRLIHRLNGQTEVMSGIHLLSVTAFDGEC